MDDHAPHLPLLPADVWIRFCQGMLSFEECKAWQETLNRSLKTAQPHTFHGTSPRGEVRAVLSAEQRQAPPAKELLLEQIQHLLFLEQSQHSLEERLFKEEKKLGLPSLPKENPPPCSAVESQGNVVHLWKFPPFFRGEEDEKDLEKKQETEVISFSYPPFQEEVLGKAQPSSSPLSLPFVEDPCIQPSSRKEKTWHLHAFYLALLLLASILSLLAPRFETRSHLSSAPSRLPTPASPLCVSPPLQERSPIQAESLLRSSPPTSTPASSLSRSCPSAPPCRCSPKASLEDSFLSFDFIPDARGLIFEKSQTPRKTLPISPHSRVSP